MSGLMTRESACQLGPVRRRTEDYIGGIIHFRECGANTVMQYTLGAT